MFCHPNFVGCPTRRSDELLFDRESGGEGWRGVLAGWGQRGRGEVEESEALSYLPLGPKGVIA